MPKSIEGDWVVVGGGSAGCVIASRLSEDSSKQVVLLEAGPDWRSSDAPPEIRSMNVWRALDETVCPQFHWQDLEARRTSGQPPRRYLRGKGLGGSSVVNGLVAFRAMADDYDRWAASGCPGWSYEEMLPYLRRMENDADFGEQPYHGNDGPIPVQRFARHEWGPLDEALAENALSLGYGWCNDHNAPTGTGVSPVALNIRNARVTTNDGYLEPARERANLRIFGEATVDRVILDGDRVTGVRVRIASEWIDVRTHGVVLCAGAIQSPAILLRSGIGPDGSVLSLPVGEGLQEHPLALFWLHLRPEASPDPEAYPSNCRLRYSSGLEGAGENDMTIAAINQTPAIPKAVLTAEGATGTWGGTSGGHAGGGPGLFAVMLCQEVSRGHLRLISPDPDAPPAIQENLLYEASDLIRMRDGVQRARELLANPTFSAVIEHAALDLTGRGVLLANPSLSAAIDLTGRGVEPLSDDEAIDRWLLNTVGDAGHICGTCRMGAPDDPRSVVDPQGRVLGIEGLWVADASVFPEVPRANTNLPTIAAAERLSDLIRGAPAPPSS